MSDTTYVSQLHANDDAKFFSDVYIYGNLYYDLDGQDNFTVDSLTVKSGADINNLYLTGVTTFLSTNVFGDSIFSADVTFQNPVDMDYLTVYRRLDVGVGNSSILTAIVDDDINDTGDFYNARVGIGLSNPLETLHVDGTVLVAAGSSVGIGSTRPEQDLDVAGSIKIDRNIFDSANSEGANGYYLQRDGHGIRWVAPQPAVVDGVFIQNEGVNLGVGSFTTLNFHGQGSGGDLVKAEIDGGNSNIANVYFTDNWVKNVAGIHTMAVNVGINVANPTERLHVVGTA